MISDYFVYGGMGMTNADPTYILQKILYRLGSTYGFQELTATYVPALDFKVRWQRAGGRIELLIPDYLEDAPEEILEEFLKELFGKMNGNAGENSQKLKEWLTRPEFSAEKQPVYLSRNTNILRKTKGEYKDLNLSFTRLQSKGLIAEIPGLYLSWVDGDSDQEIGRTSVLMKVVAINNTLDSEYMPDYVLDYCLYSELARLIVGYNPAINGELERQRLLRKFEQDKEARQWIKDAGLLL